MSHAKRIEKASGVLFFFGFICSKLQFIPIQIASALFLIVSVLLYFIAYLLWLTSCQLHPHHPRKEWSWYGFTEFKHQHRIAALIGTIAVIACIIALILPMATIPACWLFVLSNCFWCIAEYHKYKHPPKNDANYSSTQQKNYIYYTLLITAVSIISAIATTLVITCPVIAAPTLIIAAVFCFILSVTALHFWIKYSFEPGKPASCLDSHQIMAKELSAQPDLNLSPNPVIKSVQVEPDESADLGEASTASIVYDLDIEEINEETREDYHIGY